MGVVFLPGTRQIAGEGIWTGPGAEVHVEYYQCCHCLAQFEREVGQGPSTMCIRCMAPTCGQKMCDPCWPWEAKLQVMEGKIRFSNWMDGYQKQWY